jgi:hypothetical protein
VEDGEASNNVVDDDSMDVDDSDQEMTDVSEPARAGWPPAGRGAGQAGSGRGILARYDGVRSRPKRPIRWRDHNLVETFFFEMDETERGKLRKNWTLDVFL